MVTHISCWFHVLGSPCTIGSCIVPKQSCKCASQRSIWDISIGEISNWRKRFVSNWRKHPPPLSLSLSLSQYHRQSSYLLQRTFLCQQASAACGIAATVWAIWVCALTSGTGDLHIFSQHPWWESFLWWAPKIVSLQRAGLLQSCFPSFHALTLICKICRL